MQFAGISDTGRVRENNEDSYCLEALHVGPGVPSQVLLAVADGLGGYSGGEVASGLAIRTLRTHLVGTDTGGSTARGIGAATWAERLKEGITMAHAAILRQAALSGNLRGMGTTLTAAVVDGADFHWGHVGDSRAYLVRPKEVLLVTHDHSVAAGLVAAGRIGREAARRHPDRHVLTQALGVVDDLTVDTGTARLEEGEWLVLTTDGVTTVVGDDEIAVAARTSASVGAFCQGLVELANGRGGPDNITVVVARRSLPQA